MGKNLKYKSVIQANIDEATAEKLYISKMKNSLDSKLALMLSQEIMSKLNLLDKKITMFERELKVYNEPSIEELLKLLNLKETEITNLNHAIESIYNIENESNNEYMNGILNSSLVILRDKKTKTELNVRVIKEDLLTLVLMKAVDISIYEVEPIFYEDIRTDQGYFITNLNDGNILVRVTDTEVNNIKYEQMIKQDGSYIYVNIENNIPTSYLPF